MMDISNISASEFATILEPMITPLEDIDLLFEAKTRCEKQIVDAKNEGKGINFKTKVTLVSTLVILIVVFTFIWNPKSAGIPIIIVVLLVELVGMKLLYKFKIIPDTEKECRKKITEYDEKLDRIISNIPNMEYVPSQYMYYDAIASIHSYFVNGRAANWKEAVNLYEEEVHRNKMQNLAKMQAQAAQNAAAYARSANRQLQNISSKVDNLSSQVSYMDSKIH